MAPSQDKYRTDPNIMRAVQFLSRRWNKPLDDLYVLALRPGPLTELGVMDSYSLMSARLAIPRGDFSKTPELSGVSIQHEGNVYLLNEFRPSSSQELRISRIFYASTTTTLKGSHFAVIVWLKITPSGNGTIEALTDTGYLTVPVKWGYVFKRFSHVAN